MPATPDRVQAMIAALDHLDVTRARDVYWAGRLTLCAEPADLARYDVAFAAYFGADALPPPPITAPVRLRTAAFELGGRRAGPTATRTMTRPRRCRPACARRCGDATSPS